MYGWRHFNDVIFTALSETSRTNIVLHRSCQMACNIFQCVLNPKTFRYKLSLGNFSIVLLYIYITQLDNILPWFVQRTSPWRPCLCSITLWRHTVYQFINEQTTTKCYLLFYRGIKLIERNEEVCVFYEKLNVQGWWSSVVVFD